jgi:hypothetical protein
MAGTNASPGCSRSPLSSFVSVGALISCPAPREIENASGGEAVLARTQPGNHLGGFVEFKKTASRDLRQHIVDMGLRHLVEDSRPGRRRGYAIDCNVQAGKFLSQ